MTASAADAQKSWQDSVPREDLERFPGGREALDREPSFGSRPALLVVDMTRAFVEDRYPTGCSLTGEPAVRTCAALLESARANDVPVYFTKSFENPAHQPVRGQRGRWKFDIAQPSDPSIPPGDIIVDQLSPMAGEIVIHKQLKPSAFFGTTLAADLMAESIDNVIIVGMTTSGCVRASAVDAFQYNLKVSLVESGCADRSHFSHVATLFDMHMKYADVVTEERVLKLFAARGSETSSAAPKD